MGRRNSELKKIEKQLNKEFRKNECYKKLGLQVSIKQCTEMVLDKVPENFNGDAA